MESKRQQKFARLIQKDLSTVFQREVPEIVGTSFVTVTIVRMSPDLGTARVYCSVMMHSDPETLIKEINENKAQMRNILGRKIKNQVRVIPDLFFFLDTTGEEASRMDNLISGLDIPSEEV